MSAKRVRGSLKQDGTTIVLKNGATDEATLSKGANTSASNFVLPAYNGTDNLVSQNSTDTLANKTIDGDQNTVQDLALTSLKTEAGSPNQVLRRNVSGTVVADKTAPTGDFVGTTDSQTVTNKTIDADNNLITNIGDSEIAAAAAISLSKLAALTASRALQTGAGGVIESSTVTSTELGQLSGLSGNIQTQINAKVAKAGDTMTGFLTLSADPTSALHAATKAYADALSNGLRWKTPVRAASTAAVSIATGLENGDTIDGVVLVTGDRILLKDQAPSSDNGIYVVVVSGAASRAADAATATDLTNAVVFVDQGTANANRGYIQTDTLATLADPQTWTQNFGASLYVADGDGLQLSGNVFSLELDGSTLSKSASGLKVATNGVTNNEVATGIAATKLADGSVDNTEFQRLGTAGTAGSGNLVTTDGTQALTNKDIDGGVASNARRLTLPSDTKTNLDALTRKEGTLVYATDLDKVFFDNGTTLVEVGSGSGQGELNNITNSSVSSDTTGWFAQGTTTAVRQSTGGPLDPLIPTALRIDAGSATNYVRYRWTMPTALKQRKLKWEWFQRPEGTNGNEWKVEVHTNTASDYTGTDAELSLSTDDPATLNTLLPAATGKFTTTFDADASDYYEIRYIRVTGSDYLDITNVIVGPGIQPQGAVLGPWVSYTPVVGDFNNNTTLTVTGGYFRARREGESVRVQAHYIFGTQGTSTSDLELKLSVVESLIGATIDVSTFRSYAGTAFIGSTGSSPLYAYQGATGTSLDFYGSSQAAALDGNDFGSGAGLYNEFNIDMLMPVSEWAGSGTVNLAQSEVQYAFNTDVTDAANTTSFGYGPNGTPFPGSTFTAARNKTVRFQTPIQPTDVITLEIQPLGAGANGWVPLVGSGTVATTNIQGLELQNTIYYGVGIHSISSATDVIVRFGQDAYASGATYGAAGTDWDGTTDNFRWRLKKSSGGQAVGFGIASQESRGLVYSKQAITNGLASAITDATFTDTTGGTPGDTLTITPGTYLLTYGARAAVTYSVLPTGINSQVRVIDTGNIASVGTELIPMNINTATLYRGAVSMSSFVTITTTTAYKVQGYIDVLGGTVSDRSIQNAFMIWERVS